MKSDQISQTAAFVAIKFYGLTRIKTFRSLFDQSVVDFYDRLVQALPAPLKYYHFWLRSGWVRKLYIWSEELLLPGDLLHVVARKWKIQHMTNQLVDKGYKQIIVLGAGFDHLAYYYSQKGLSCFEFDSPHMAALKHQFLNDHYPDRPHPEIIPSHLPENKIGTQLLEHPDINSEKKTIVIAEGFFDYLAPAIVGLTLRQIQSFFSNDITLVGTHFALGELSKFHRWVFKNSVRIVGEQLEFNTSAETFRQILKDKGFTTCQLFDSHQISDKISERIKTSLTLLKGFYLFKAT